MIGQQPDHRDLNGDGAVSAADAVMLARFIAEDETVPEIQTALLMNADADQDGSLTILDVIAFLKSL